MSTPPRSFRFALRNSLPEIARMTDWLRESLAMIDAGDELSHAVCLSVVEAATNVVSYAFAPETEHVVDISLEATADLVTVVISDDGLAFDPLAQAPPAPATDLATVAIGGLGITLMRQFSSGIHYRREGARNRLEMTYAR
jgi:anti-sigma regulatory factor (Ser/Thr protein kinase)